AYRRGFTGGEHGQPRAPDGRLRRRCGRCPVRCRGAHLGDARDDWSNRARLGPCRYQFDGLHRGRRDGFSESRAGAVIRVTKMLFDLLFSSGTLAFGLATLLIFGPGRRGIPARIALAIGLLGTLASVAALLGADAGRAVGAAIGAGVVV